jgi:sortase A
MRRWVQILGWTLVWSGLFAIGFVGWQVFGTDVANGRVQAAAGIQLDQSFVQTRQDLPEVEEVPVLEVGEVSVEDAAPESAPDVVEYYAEDQPAEDTEFAYLSIPSLDLEAVVFEGVTVETLRKGPGHMPWTPLPGQAGNAVISGHRTTYGRPFFDFDQLKPGDRIEIETAIGIHVYVVRDSFVVKPTDVWVTEDREGSWLTMTTCNPKFSARERLIITAELVEGPNAAYISLLLEGRVKQRLIAPS